MCVCVYVLREGADLFLKRAWAARKKKESGGEGCIEVLSSLIPSLHVHLASCRHFTRLQHGPVRSYCPARNTFLMEDMHGRARVFNQQGHRPLASFVACSRTFSARQCSR